MYNLPTYTCSNGGNPTVDALLGKMAQDLQMTVPCYELGQPMEKNVLATYDTDDKKIRFGSANPEPFVVVHEGSHAYHDQMGWHCQREQCEEFAYAFEKMYGKANKLYRHAGPSLPEMPLILNRGCSDVGGRLNFTKSQVGNLAVKSSGAAMLIGAGVGLAHYHLFNKSKKTLGKDVALSALAVTGAALAIIG